MSPHSVPPLSHRRRKLSHSQPQANACISRPKRLATMRVVVDLPREGTKLDFRLEYFIGFVRQSDYASVGAMYSRC